MTTAMDRAILVETIVRLVADNTERPHQGASTLCAAVALFWLATEGGAQADDAGDAHMISEFSRHLADAVQTFRGGISEQSVRALQ